MEPPELDNVRVCVVASDVFATVCSSLVTDPSTSVIIPVFVIVRTPLRPVPVVASPMPVPSTNCMLPPELDSVAVWEVALEVLAMVWSSLVIDWSGSVFVSVITFPASLIERPVEAVNVTSVDPVVFELITEVVPVPAVTVRDPSFVFNRSPVFVIMVPVTSIPVPAV